MSGQLVGAVITSAARLRAAGFSRNAVTALIVIAEGIRDDTLEGRVARTRIAGACFASERTASRAVSELVDRDVVEVRQRGHRYGLDHGGVGVSTLYRLGQSWDIWMSRDCKESRDTQASRDRAKNAVSRDTQVSRDSTQSRDTERQSRDIGRKSRDTQDGTVPVDLPVDNPSRVPARSGAHVQARDDDFRASHRRRTQAAALAKACPHCEAVPGAACTDPAKGHVLDAPHGVRARTTFTRAS